ncbi:Gfo/Idh/MocA family protein [Psychromonas ossibalaenae]|uniref:Gfo/Idh/MocA family protein n=1 Tax=Psychromonas ossibalaenae TaxID=444922 RepID=UPI00035C808E|nr:Gfo/Idh/MocA family oxidoreductase [Psychromonas ossibalaenae]
MINFAVIGTNWISEEFVNATLINNKLQLNAVYSRHIETAEKFAAKYQVKNCFNDLNKLSKSDTVQAVYIGSPNSLHFEQALMMLNQGKHVICEKPLASNAKQVEILYQTAVDNNVVLFEAYKTACLPNFVQIKNNIAKLGKLRKAHIHYCQYSSRYQKYLNGENPNTFNPEYSNGSIMDIGYYCVAFTVALFGKPEQILATATLLDSGVDGAGAVLLNYGQFTVSIDHSKISDSVLPSEIQGEQGNLVIKHISLCEQVNLHQKQQITDLTLPQPENSMVYEADFFAQQIQQGKMDEKTVLRSKQTADVITQIRALTKVKFPADELFS